MTPSPPKGAAEGEAWRCLIATRRSSGSRSSVAPVGAQVNKAGGSLSISPPLGLTPPGYELSPLRGWGVPVICNP